MTSPAHAMLIGKGGTPYLQIYSAPDDSGIQLLSALPIEVTAPVEAIRFSPDGSQLAVMGTYTKIINTSDWTIATSFNGPSNIRSAAWSPDGSLLAVGRNSGPAFLRIFSATDWSYNDISLGDAVWGCAFSPGGDYLALAVNSSPYLIILDTANWSVVSGTPALAGVGQGIAWSPDGSRLAIAHNNAPRLLVLNTADWSVVSGTPIPSVNGARCAWSPDGSKLAWCATSYTIIFSSVDWSALTGQLTLASTIRDVAWSHDGAHLAVASSSSPYFRLYSSSDWSVVSVPSPPNNSTYSVAWSPVPIMAAAAGVVETEPGPPISGAAVQLTLPDRTLICATTTDATGRYRLISPYAGRHVRTVTDARAGAQRDLIDQPVLGMSESPDTVHVLWPIGDPVAITGNVTTQAAAPADKVAILLWRTLEVVALIEPDAEGDWSADLPPGDYGLAYFAAGCQPVIHGPYHVAPE